MDDLFLHMPGFSATPTLMFKLDLKLALGGKEGGGGRGEESAQFGLGFTSAKLARARQVSTTSFSPLS